MRLLFPVLIFLLSSIVFAGESKTQVLGFSIKDLISLVTAVIGGGVGTWIFLLPAIRRIRRKFETLLERIRQFYMDYRQDPKIIKDLRKILQALDDVTEEIASLLRKFRMKRAAEFMTNLVKQDLYK